MPQDTGYENTKLEKKAISYKNRLNGWTIARVAQDQQRVIVARFRSKSDADGYIQHLRQLVPEDSFEMFFDSQILLSAV
ncbi:hypothetical protein [Cylindrospermopsis raciborskii]|uniref:Uncharacterized protein n=1 Tax=Cylindrospermopsis raciborskii CENA302 TaxID=1170768 RepID=A0A9Q5QZH1_9CYAN|nr:hypothetical protein [Cylindrospermopsis raciborskii]MCZ2200921.1 hypothetical protein [Cylindrospermopsis raciborskii PAMP2012]MCZ2206500.1 hypothetical protein [Cylindrospermopsis raciborskii PAMP2011]NLQ03814.1 hypothetical protein [Cylindrospermopsis raciborskii MVCC19]OHY34001.1 hypothetical protein BCV64_07415 [Cylindrospermopsis raciborskii MVCC14]OPH10982.1 hypothetical protein CENA302_02450 [Cylindrospermopsis raciborskii CENA302]